MEQGKDLYLDLSRHRSGLEPGTPRCGRRYTVAHRWKPQHFDLSLIDLVPVFCRRLHLASPSASAVHPHRALTIVATHRPRVALARRSYSSPCPHAPRS
jgi:hypothetical protein